MKLFSGVWSLFQAKTLFCLQQLGWLQSLAAFNLIQSSIGTLAALRFLNAGSSRLFQLNIYFYIYSGFSHSKKFVTIHGHEGQRVFCSWMTVVGLVQHRAISHLHSISVISTICQRLVLFVLGGSDWDESAIGQSGVLANLLALCWFAILDHFWPLWQCGHFTGAI